MSLYIEEHIVMSFLKGCCYQEFSEMFLSKTLDAGISFVFFLVNQNVMVHKSTGGHCLSIVLYKERF